MKTRKMLLSVLLLFTLSGGCVAVIGAASPGFVTATAVPLHPDRPAKTSIGPLHFLGALDIPGSASTGGEPLGGLSGLWVDPAGRRFVAIGDTGLVAEGGLDHDATGRLTGVHDVRTRPLAVEEGASASKSRVDAEDLTRLPDGGWLVTLERDHRILRYPSGAAGPDGILAAIPLPPQVAAQAPRNSGLEALTRLPDGRLLTMEEGRDDGDRSRRAWVTRPGLADGLPRDPADWGSFTYLAAPRYRPTAVAPLPDGGAVVLERRVSLLGGWSSRLVRLAPAQIQAGAVAEGEELGRLEAPLLNDNFEGIATRPGPDGATLIYLVSDNNFSMLQRTYLVLFALGGPAS